MSKSETQQVKKPAEDRAVTPGSAEKSNGNAAPHTSGGRQIQLTRNVGNHLYGETFRVADEAEAEKLGFKSGDYKFTGA